jgi:hypothetical protein
MLMHFYLFALLQGCAELLDVFKVFIKYDYYYILKY